MVQVFTKEMINIVCLEQVNYMTGKYNIPFSKIQLKVFDINFMVNQVKNYHLQDVLKLLLRKP